MTNSPAATGASLGAPSVTAHLTPTVDGPCWALVLLHRKDAAMSKLVEGLEGRRLMSATISGGMLTYTGTDGADFAVATASVNGAGDRIVTLQTFDAMGESLSNDVFGGIESVTLIGLGGDDTLVVAGAGLTVNLVGGAGGDYLEAIASVSTLDGGEGDDLLIATGITPEGMLGGASTIFGGDGVDTISADAGLLMIDCGDGNDTASFSSKSGTVLGGKGDDQLYSKLWSADGLSGEGGTGNIINGQQDADTISALTTDKVVGNVKGDAITIVS